MASTIDVVGLGLNAVDTVHCVRHFPSLGSKVEVVSSSEQPGGQVSTALVACSRLGLRTRYLGTFGGDTAARIQRKSLLREGVDITFAKVFPGVPNQFGCIILDQSTGERTVLWGRDPRLAFRPSMLRREALKGGRLLLVDGCDVSACLRAARWARQMGIPVLADLDTAYKGLDRLLPHIDYLIAAREFLQPMTGHRDCCRALRVLASKYGVRAPGVTLGRNGALLYWQGRFLYSPGFVVEAVDTTGAGDVFHGAFAFGLLSGWEMSWILDFANAMAALNCTALGARGRIGPRQAAERLMATGRRRVNPAFVSAIKRGQS